MFETDIIPWPILDSPPPEEIEDEFADFLQEFEFGVPEVETFYKHPIKDLEGNPLLDLLDIEVYE